MFQLIPFDSVSTGSSSLSSTSFSSAGTVGCFLGLFVGVTLGLFVRLLTEIGIPPREVEFLFALCKNIEINAL